MGEQGADAVLRFPLGGKDVDLIAGLLEHVKSMDLDLADGIAERRQAETQDRLLKEKKCERECQRDADRPANGMTSEARGHANIITKPGTLPVCRVEAAVSDRQAPSADKATKSRVRLR